MQNNEEGADALLRFVVTCDDGTVRAVELRGREIRGVLDDGDRVAFPVSAASGDGLQRPGFMRNLTTDSAVTAWRPPRWRSVGGPLVQMLASALVSALVTAVVGAVLTVKGVGAGPGAEAPAAVPPLSRWR